MKKQTVYKFPTWNIVHVVLADLGWNLVKKKTNYFLYQRDNQSLIAREVNGKWKVERFRNRRMQISTGFSDEKFSRILAMELAIG
jgi:hypothetical protein